MRQIAKDEIHLAAEKKPRNVFHFDDSEILSISSAAQLAGKG